jgi:hypothetical protein
MVSSKLLRRPTRGAVGTGLRVCLGYLTATEGGLIIETGSLRVELAPEIDGASRIVRTSAVKPRQGLRLTGIVGNAPFTKEHLSWAEDAIELAKQWGSPAFTGRPSPHWLDLDHFRMLLRSAVGNVSVRQFLGELDGCTGSRAQTRIAARFLRRSAADLDAAEAAELLAAAQAATKPPKHRALRPLGRDAVVTRGYAIAEGTFTEGAHPPHAQVPFLVECWADAFFPDEQADRLISALRMNRTRAIVPCTGNAWHGILELSVSGTELRVSAPGGPHYSIMVNITSPMFRLTSDGKMPDCRRFRPVLIEAIGKAANQAGRDIAARMKAEEKREAAYQQQQQQQEREAEQQLRIADRAARQERLARIEAEKAERKALPKMRDVVLKLLPGAIKIESASGLMFNTRRLVYRIRDEVQRRTSKELTQNYFEKLVTEIEAKRGDLSPLLIREARGNYSIPHDYGGWDKRHDALFMSAKGFNTRASRDLIDKITGEPDEAVKVYSAHDADAAGTVLHHALQHATLARGGRSRINMGLEPWEGVALGLGVEKVPIKYTKEGEPIRRPVGAYVKARTDRAPNGERWEDWLQHSRFELNAFTSAELIAWLDAKMAEAGDGKLIPPDDVLQDGFAERVRGGAAAAVAKAVERHQDEQIATIEAEKAEATKDIRAETDRITADLRKQLELVSEPFLHRIQTAKDEANAIDQEAEVHRVTEQITPDGDELRAAIEGAFSDKPKLRWTTVLHEIAHETGLSDIDDNEHDGNEESAP